MKKKYMQIIQFLIFLLIINIVHAIGPQITGVNVNEDTKSKVTIIFNTDAPSNYILKYGLDLGMSSQIKDDKVINTEKKITISGLYPGRTYYYELTICDYYSECSTYGPYTFRISDSAEKKFSSNSEDMSWSIMNEGSNTMFVKNTDLNIQSIEFRLSEILYNTRAKVNKLLKRPDGIDYLTYKSYRYFDISTFNIPKETLIYLDINFYVTKEWLSFNKIDTERIALYHYGNSWEKLDTFLLSSDSENVYFSAATDQIGIFAIAESEFDATPVAQKITNFTINETPVNDTLINLTNNTESPMQVQNPNVEEIINEVKEEFTQELQKNNFILDKKLVTNIIMGFSAFMLIVAILGIILNIKGDQKHDKELKIFKEKTDIKSLIKKINKNIQQGKNELAKQQYQKLAETYSQLSHDDKSKHYPKIEQIIKKL